MSKLVQNPTSKFFLEWGTIQINKYFKDLKKNRPYFLEQFWVHIKIEWKVQSFPIYPLSPLMHAPPPTINITENGHLKKHSVLASLRDGLQFSPLPGILTFVSSPVTLTNRTCLGNFNNSVHTRVLFYHKLANIW